jgi:hypothetical protein
MNEKLIVVIFAVALIFILAVSGCLALPKQPPLTAITEKTTISHKPILTVTPTATPVYVTIETPYGTPTIAYRTIPPIVTPVAEDYVKIYSIKKQPFAHNKSAVSFDLKNPPMLIDFQLYNTDIKRNISGKSRVLKNEWTFNNTVYSDPNAYFEVTVREKSTDKIVLQDGFGQSKQYGTQNPRQLKVYSAGNYLIEFSGNKLTADINMSVKREGNINQSVI